MSAPSDCDCRCETPVVISVPGTEGDAGTAGADGSNGINAFTTVDGTVSIQDISATKTINVADSRWMAENQNVFIDGSGYFTVTAKPSITSVTLFRIDNVYNNTGGFTDFSDGKQISPCGSDISVGALPNTITDSSGGTASDVISANVGVFTLIIPLSSLITGLSTLAIDLLTTYVPGFNFKILKFDWVTTIVGLTGSQTFHLAISGTPVTSTLLVNAAGANAIGKVIEGTPNPIIAANVGLVSDSISIKMDAGGTAFATSGAGYFVIKIQNMDTANAFKSLSTHINDIITPGLS